MSRDQTVKIVPAAETTSSLLDDPDVLDVLDNTTNETRPETNTDTAPVGRLDAAQKDETPTPKKRSRGRPKGTTKQKDPTIEDVKTNFAVVMPPERAKAFLDLIEKLDSEGMGKVNANIALNNAVELLLAKHKDK